MLLPTLALKVTVRGWVSTALHPIPKTITIQNTAMSAYKLIKYKLCMRVEQYSTCMMLPEPVAIQTDVLGTLSQYQGEGSVSVQLYLVQQLQLLLPRPRNRR